MCVILNLLLSEELKNYEKKLVAPFSTAKLPYKHELHKYLT